MLLTEVGGGERHSFVEVVAEVPDHAAHDGGAADLELDVANSSGGRVDSADSDLPIYPQLEHILGGNSKSNEGSRRFHNYGECPTRAFS